MNTTLEQKITAAEVAALNPLGLRPLVEYQAKKGCKIDEMTRGGTVPYPREIKDGERLIVRVDGVIQNGKHSNIGVTFLNGNTAMFSTEQFHKVEGNQFSNRYKSLAQFHS